MSEMTDMNVVEASDEGRHDPEPDRLWNESWYFDFEAGDGDIGGWVRLGLYPNMGIAWYTAELVGAGRDTIAIADFSAPPPEEAAGPVETAQIRADHVCEVPLERWRVTAQGQGRRLDSPADAYLLPNAGENCAAAFDLVWDTDGVPFHYGFTTRYEIPCRVSGSVSLDGTEITVDGSGQRDHSWAVRDWWSVGWLWTAGRLDDGTRFHVAHIRLPGAPVSFGYVEPPGGGVDVVTGSTIDRFGSDSFDGDMLPKPARLELEPCGLAIEITPIAHAPVLLSAEDGRTTHFPRALCRFVAADGRRGIGWTEWNIPGAALGD